ncbi:ATP-binding protein [Streptomyces sp. NPDC003247]|uniref:ATP-binding protein n=1 Tax=Streptomyces sp. NPDC003247 TaxID=3364677 RepID=UPI0036BBC40B
MPRRPWSRAFTAEPTEVAGLRRALRSHLAIWGLHGITDDAQLCLSELVSNVITHVGPGTPATLTVSMNGVHLRIEVRDPDTRALPTLLDSNVDSEGGRGMALVDAVAERWGVELRVDRKVTWCELATKPTTAISARDGSRLNRAEGLLDLYGRECGLQVKRVPPHGLSLARAEETAIDIIVDLLQWLHHHGRDAERILDRAHIHFTGGANASA